MKKVAWVTGVLVMVALALAGAGASSGGAVSSVTGKRIALDAGHGGDELGAQYPAESGQNGLLFEKTLNLDVVYALRDLLAADGAKVVLTRTGDETLPTRRERVKLASELCQQQGGECDALVSVHHNGSTDASHDGMLVIYTQKQDFALAQAAHDALLRLSRPPACGQLYSYSDEGYIQGGYGMTKTPMISILTEAYYITNGCEGLFLLDPDNWDARVQEEATALYNGIVAYFSALGSGSGCPPGKAQQGKC